MKWLALVAVLGGCDVLFQVDRVPEIPPDAPIAGRWSEVAAGFYYTCALDLDQHLWCWGRDAAGQLGNGTAISELDVVTKIGTSTWSTIRASAHTTCGIQTDGTLWCWGLNDRDQVGAMDAGKYFSTPQLVEPSAIDVSPGDGHTCAIDTQNQAWCWGANSRGQLGNATTTSSASPTLVASAVAFARIETSLAYSATPGAGNDGSTYAIATDGSLWGWGGNDRGQLGGGSPSATPQVTPIQISTDAWSEIAAGQLFACGITTAGQLRCWGNNSSGELGDGTTATRAVPGAVLLDGVDATNWKHVYASLQQACAVTTEGRAYCWGANSRGQIGDAVGRSTKPIEIAGHTWEVLATGVLHTCGVATDHTLWCLGGDGYGELGDGGSSTTAPVRIGTKTYSAVDVGFNFTCMIDSTGSVECAGDNLYGGLGVGDVISRNAPAPVGSGFSKIATGTTHACATKTDNTVSCWGANYYGQLGIGNFTDATTQSPVRAGKLAMTGFGTSCTIDPQSAQMFCWGGNAYGQVGNGTKTAGQPTPAGISALLWETGSSGFKHTCGVQLSSKIMYCWGDNAFGQLGNNTMMEKLDPTTASTGVQGDVISAGGFHTCALAGTTLYCWGAGYTGQTGLGNNAARLVPTALGMQWKAVSAGDEATCAIRTDGALFCWGRNDRGQLGIGTYDAQFSPARVGTDSDWASVAMKEAHACAIKTDGSLWCWGDNSNGALANGLGWRTTPVQVP
jgi:alpha-tubulin suppressor-like RCC1 family protein